MFGFWEMPEGTPPPPPRSSVFVMRNGRYEPQNLMPVLPRPEAMDFDGFVPRRGHGQGLQSRPPEMRQASLFKNPVNIRKDTVRIKSASEGQERSTISFTFDALRPGRLSIFMFVTEAERASDSAETTPGAEDAQAPEPPTRSAHAAGGIGVSERTLELYAQASASSSAGSPNADGQAEPLRPEPLQVREFTAGLGQVFESDAVDFGQWPEASLAFDPSRPKDVPFCVLLELSEETNEEKATHYTYMAFHKASGLGDSPCSSPGRARDRPPWRPQVMAQKLQYGSQCFVLHEVFGVVSKSLKDTETEGGNADCIICLSEPRDTAVLPCRHLCFCGYCAGIVRLQCDRCPVCRQTVVTLLQFVKDGDVEEAKVAPQAGGVVRTGHTESFGATASPPLCAAPSSSSTLPPQPVV